MRPRAQAGLEYLVHFGWALVLLLSIVGALFFLPSQNVSFASSMPERLIVKEAIFSNQLLALKLHNPSSKSLELVAIGLQGSFKEASCSVEDTVLSPEESFSLDVGPGAETILQCEPVSVLEGEISLTARNIIAPYDDDSFEETLTITLSPLQGNGS
jgi:hypothetical protein